MPEAKTIQKARRDKKEGKAPSTKAGEFVREEIHHIRKGKHGATSPEQAIAIGLAKARRAGVKLKPPAKGEASPETRKRAKRDYEAGQGERKPQRRPRASKAALHRLEKKPQSTASHAALSRHAKRAAASHTASERSAAARKAVRTKGHAGLVAAGRKAARTRARHAH